MKRRLFNLAAAVSALLCLLSVAAAVRSVFAVDIFSRPDANGSRTVHIILGEGGIRYSKAINAPVQTGRETWRHSTASPPRRWSSWVDFRITTGHENLRIPYILLIALTLPVQLLWFWHYKKLRKAARMGLCQNCGYDLRASPERCPECGTAAAESSGSTRPSIAQ